MMFLIFECRFVKLCCVVSIACLLPISARTQQIRPLRAEVSSKRSAAFVRSDQPAGQSDWFMRDRRYPPASPRTRTLARTESAAQKLREAFAEADRVRSLTTATAQPTWAELGPRPQLGSRWGNVSGRVTSLAIDPGDKAGNTVFVGTAFGGLWKCAIAPEAQSANTYADCNPLGHFDDQVTLSIGSIAVSSRSGNTVIYVGTGEANGSADSYYGQGILRSADGGKSWDKPIFYDDMGHDFSGAAVAKIVIDPTNPDLVLAAVTSASLADGRSVTLGIYISHDAGKSWHLELSNAGTSDLLYEPTRHTFYAAFVGGGIYKRSTDGSGDWKPVASPFQCTGAVTDTNFYRASLASRGGVLWALISDNQGQLSQPSDDDFGIVESRDGGGHWTPVRAPEGLLGGQGDYNQYIEAPSNSSELVVGGIDVWSTNTVHGFDTEWTNLTNAYYSDVVHPDQHALAYIDGNRWYIGNDGGLWATRNAGGNWTNLNMSIGAIQFISVTPDPNVPGVYLGGSQDNDVAYRIPASVGKWSTTLGGDGGYTDIDQQKHYFAENNNVSLFYSDSSSGQWKTVVDRRTINERQAFYIPYAVLPGRETQIALGTFRVWLGPATPECPGAGWKPASDDLTKGIPAYVTAIAARPNSPKVVAAVTSDSLVQETVDIYASVPKWTNIGDANLPTGRAYSSVAFSTGDPDIMYVGVMGFGTGFAGSGTGHVFKRIKVASGFKWINISGNLKDVPVNSVLVDPVEPNDVYVATDAGVWITSDGGSEDSQWTLYGEGLPHSAVLQLKMSPQDKRILVAATHGRGAWVIPPHH
jgi:hypothetical protein